MASKLLFNKDYKRRFLSYSNRKKQFMDSIAYNDFYIPIEYRNYLLSRSSRNVSRSKIKNRCVLTGRSKAVYSYFKLSRMAFKELATKAQMVGIKKHSW